MNNKKVVIANGRICFMDASATIVSFESKIVEEKRAELLQVCIGWANGAISHEELEALVSGR